MMTSFLAPLEGLSRLVTRSTLRIVDPLLIDALRSNVLEGSTSPNLQGMFLPPTASINEPFEALFYNRRRILEVAADENEHAGKHARVLLDFMEQECTATWEKALQVENESCQTIAFEDSWLLYHPHNTVFRKDEGGWRAYKISRTEVGPRPSLDPIRIYAYYLDFDKSGKMLVPHLEMFTASPYPSEQPIENLEVIPAWHIRRHADWLPRKLVDRGNKYWGHRGKPFYREYRGDAWPTTLENNVSRVMVDHVTSSKHDRGGALADVSYPQCLACLGEALQLGPFSEGPYYHDPDVCIRTRGMDWVNPSNEGEISPLLYCPSMTWAFSFPHRTWAMVRVDDLTDVRCQSEDWDRLQMGEDSKDKLDEIVSSFLGMKKRSATASAGEESVTCPYPFKKGRGFNVHLHGNPGTGKSYTAECLSGKYGIPLYQISCGILGTEPTALDKELQVAILRAANWGAILMLDDADVYLQERDPNQLERNALVSTFLYHLDRSEALVFLATTYRARPDKACLSFTHFALHFPDLTFAQQQNIWCHLLSQMSLDIGDRAILEEFIRYRLGKLDANETPSQEKGNQKRPWHQNMNGRQIQNCLRAAMAIAKREQVNNTAAVIRLKEDHIKKVLGFGTEFRKYVQDLGNAGRCGGSSSVAPSPEVLGINGPPPRPQHQRRSE
ncbi:ATPase AAA-type core domain-containing protein [Madurella fahalii]|uniref:ATPase AAA-type core domain-containing protein n=1 Tax=Madurella fahalii TaxID=1157608 RepID=A0ABQ0GJK1_9PEZI